MTTAIKKAALVKAHASPPVGMLFYNTLEGVRRDVNLLGNVSVIERAWKEMKLDGALCLDSRPVLYLKVHGRPFSSRERIRLQKLFWNQGVANILVLADPTSVYIYSGLTEPQNEQSGEDAAENALIKKLTLTEYTLQIQALYHGLASGHYYETNRPSFSPDQTVDAWLLENLRALRNSLIQGDERLTTRDAHAFIGRVLFLCYLLDREIVSVGKPDKDHTATMRFAEILEGQSYDSQISYLYGLFDELKNRFNGNMFDQDLKAERRLIRPGHLRKLVLFLGGHQVESGQRTLGFWPFNFKMIPVETISAIYEDFLTTEDPENKRSRGAFYTPRFLAEMVVDVAVRDDPELLNGVFLDPACGSGIFLVILFNRLANRWIHTRTKSPHYINKAKALQDILARQIRGVDIEETACRIACFSLYLAYLDFFDPPDIQKHANRTGRPLPKLLNYGDVADRPLADIPVILKADCLAEETLPNEIFNCIVGNPPWEGRGSKQIAQQFMQKAPKLLKKDGTGCLLLPTKILQNQTDTFQGQWLKQVTLETVLQLADYRRLLFLNAKTPAFIARFKNAAPQLSQHRIEFTAPKFNRDGLRKGVVTINPSSRTWVPLADILAATQSKTAPVVWKRRLWGTQRDQKLLDLLQSLPPLKEQVDLLSELRKKRKEKSKRWVAGEGIKPWPLSKTKSDRKLKPIIWPLNMAFIEASPWNSDLLILENDTILFEKRLRKKGYRTDVLYSQPPQDLFLSPIVLFSRGFEKVAYSDSNVIFQHALRSISGPIEDSDLLMFLSAYLRSNLARFFLFHTSTNWGTERDQVHLGEVLRVPFPLPGNEFISPNSKKIVKQIVQKIEQLKTRLQDTFREFKSEAKRFSLLNEDAGDADTNQLWHRERKGQVDEVQNQIEPMIYSYFGLTDQEIMLVEDTIQIFEPSSTPSTWNTPKTVTLNPLNDPQKKLMIEPYSSKGLGAYADTLTNTLNYWAKTEGSQYRVQAEGGADEYTGLAMVTVSLANAESAFQLKPISQKLAENLNSFHLHASKEHGTLFYQRDIFLFQGKRINIIRPNILLNWTRTAALNDAARIYGEIVQSSGEF